MPLYDYRCDACGKTYDVFHKVREVAEDVVCPSCKSPRHTRLLSAPMVMVGKGEGRAAGYDVPPPSCADGSCCGGTCGLE